MNTTNLFGTWLEKLEGMRKKKKLKTMKIEFYYFHFLVGLGKYFY